MNENSVLAIVLAGGEGKRLMPLTKNRAKPAIPFGGQYRIIDFVMSNLVHSNILRVHVLTQYQSYSLIRHLSRGWAFAAHLGQYCEIMPATSGEGRGWYQGSADALYQTLRHASDAKPKMLAVFGADHVYRMDVGQMIEEHIDSKADISVSVVPQPRSESHRYGCVRTDSSLRVREFLEKPSDPPLFEEDREKSLVSMGNYIFNFEVLMEILLQDHENPESRHDIGGDILPKWFDRLHVHAYNFGKNRIPGANESEIGYWRDVGTLDAYWKASMDLVSVSPVFNLYNMEWPILTVRTDYPPAKFVFANQQTRRLGIATDSLVCNGAIISGGHIDRTVLGSQVRINSFAEVTESVLFENVEVGRRCRIDKTIIDKGVEIPPDTTIGVDEEEDRARGITVTETGIRVVPQGLRL